MGIGDILRALANGEYDGARSDNETNGVAFGFYIKEGTPVKYREGQGSRFFDGKENVRTPGKRTEESFDSDEEKTAFFEKYGFKKDMFSDHPEVVDYSKQYYQGKNDRH